jgi:uncharacterized protein YbaP (TraB family)
MMGVKYAALLLSMSVTAICYAQSKKPAAPAENTLLWEISGRGLTAPSYVYGTMHIICADEAKMSMGLKNAIAKSKQVFFEIDMDNMDEMMGFMKYARMNNGLKISDLVSPVEYMRLEEYFSKHQSIIPFAMMSRFKPYFITAIVSEDIMDCKEKSSIEQMIMTEARNADKDVLGLETVEFQASIFDSIPYEKQAHDLVTYIDSIDQFRQNTLEMADLYRKQDISHMDTLMEKSDPGMMQYMDLLLYDRNRRWADQMPEQMFLMPTLFAVGAGHLGGERGVLNLLRQLGFTVKPLDNTQMEKVPVKNAQVTKSGLK